MITKNQLQKIEQYVSARLDSLNWYHTQAARSIAQKLAHLEKADKEIVDVAVLFHDIGKYKGDDGHVQRSADVARKFLEKENFEQRFVEEVVYCIIIHEFPWIGKANQIQTIEAKIVCDADIIQKLSSYGVIKHSIKYQEDFNKDFDSGVKRSWEKLMKCYNVILTKNGQKLAAPGYKFIKDFYRQLS